MFKPNDVKTAINLNNENKNLHLYKIKSLM